MLELIQQIQQGDNTRFEDLLHHFENIIRGICHRYYLPNGDIDDLMQEGRIGLYWAVVNYQPERNSNFEVFAQMVIKRKVLSAITQSRRVKHEQLNRSYSLHAEVYDNIQLMELLSDLSFDDRIREVEQDFSLEQFIKQVRLSKMEEKVLRLFLYGQSYEEMTIALNCRFKSVDNTMQRIRKKVKKHYQWELIAN